MYGTFFRLAELVNIRFWQEYSGSDYVTLTAILDILEFLFQLFCVFDGVSLGVVVEIDVDGAHLFGLVF